MNSIKATARQAGVLYLLLAIAAPFNLMYEAMRAAPALAWFTVALLPAAGALAQTPARRPVANSLPAFSPDGRHLAFVSRRDGNGEIYVMDPDGSNQRRLTHTPEEEGRPSWSPDGTRLVFHVRAGPVSSLWVVGDDGTDRSLFADTLQAQTPAWARDGRLAAGVGAFPSRRGSTSGRSGRPTAPGSRSPRSADPAARSRSGSSTPTDRERQGPSETERCGLRRPRGLQMEA